MPSHFWSHFFTLLFGVLTVGSFRVALSRKQKQQQKATSKV